MNLDGVLAALAVPAQYWPYVAAAVAACAAITAAIPPPKNQKTGWAYIYNMLDFIALNFGNGKTAAKALVNGELTIVADPAKKAD